MDSDNKDRRVQKLIEHLSSNKPTNSWEELNKLEANETLASDDTSFGAKAYDLYRTFTADMPFSVKRHGGHLVAKVLEAHQVKFIFTLSGGHISPM